MLISCKKCNKLVSDKAKTCPHCGTALILDNSSPEIVKENKTASKKTKNYIELEVIERVQLREEFNKENPTEYNTICTSEKRARAQLIVGAVALALSILGIILLHAMKDTLDKSEPSAGEIILVLAPAIIAIITWVIFAYLSLISKFSRQKVIIAANAFEKWLKQRGIEGYAEIIVEDSVERKMLDDLDI